MLRRLLLVLVPLLVALFAALAVPQPARHARVVLDQKHAHTTP